MIEVNIVDVLITVIGRSCWRN